MIWRRSASEFPNDNPELHDGLVWACPEPCARPLPTLRMRPPVGSVPRVLEPAWEHTAAAHEATVALSDVALEPPALEPVEPELAVPGPAAPELREIATEPAAPELREIAIEPVAPEPVAPEPSGPFDTFVSLLARVAMDRGAMRAAAAVRALLTDGRLVTQRIEPELLANLVRRRMLASNNGHVSPEFAAATHAWRALLEGLDADFSACGSATLDAWAAELLAAVMNAPSAQAELRRELRRAGVAAFGLLAVA